MNMTLEINFKELNALYKLVDDEFNSASKKIKPDMSDETIIAHNYLRDARKEIIKLMVLKELIEGREGPLSPVPDYLDKTKRLISAPEEKAEVSAFKHEMEKLHLKSQEREMSSRLTDVIINLKNNMSNFSNYLSISEFIASMNKLKESDESLVSDRLRQIKNGIHDSILGHHVVRTDAERDLTRNRDFQIGSVVIDEIDILLKNPSTNITDEEKLKRLHLALNNAKLEIKYEIKYNTKHTALDTKSLNELGLNLKSEINKIETEHPELKESNQLALEEKERKLIIEMNEKVKAKKAESKEQEISIGKNKPAWEREKKLKQLSRNLSKKLDLIWKEQSKIKYKSQTVENATIKNRIGNIAERISKAQPNDLKTILEFAETELKSGKSTSKWSRLFRSRSPEEKFSDLIHDALKSLTKIEEKYGSNHHRMAVKIGRG